MNQLLTNLFSASKNLHVSVPLGLAVVLEIAPIWFPNFKTQFAETQKVLLMYGVISAANSAPTPTPPKP